MTTDVAALRDYMSELSEQAWHAGWMTDLEYALWSAINAGPRRYGQLELSTHHLERLRVLSNACGGWVRFDDMAGEEVFVPLGTWKDLVAKRAAESHRPAV
jgi:hypothetical protein